MSNVKLPEICSGFTSAFVPAYNNIYMFGGTFDKVLRFDLKNVDDVTDGSFTAPLFTMPVVQSDKIYNIDNMEGVAYYYDCKENSFHEISPGAMKNQIIREGKLNKRSQWFRNFRIRHVILTPSYLTTCKSTDQEDVDNPTEKIILNEIQDVIDMSDETNQAFQCVTRLDEYFFKCLEGSGEKNAWM